MRYANVTGKLSVGVCKVLQRWRGSGGDVRLFHLCVSCSSHSTPQLGVPSIAISFGVEKLEWCSYPMVKKV